MAPDPACAGQTSLEPASDGRAHRVHLYDDEDALAEVVAGFIEDGLTSGEPVLVIAGASRVAAVCSRLWAHRKAVDHSRLRFIDADALIAELFVGDMPDRSRFRTRVAAALDQIGPGGQSVRVFGEAVDILCRQGRHAQARRLEEMWNELAAVRPFSLLCAYSITSFRGRAGAEELGKVRDQHRGGTYSDDRSAREQTSRLVENLIEEARVKDEFIAMLSHELRGPLAPIRTALQLMELRGDTGVTRERTIVERQIATLVRLVDDLLDVSRIAAGKIEVERGRLDLCDVIETAVEITGPACRERGHALHVRASRGVAFVDGDPVRLAQIVTNLVSNAIRYTERDGHISLDLAVEDREVVLRVRDNGVGIRPDLLPRVFERGVQGPHGSGGLGLGLTIVRALVELHGGAVTAHSDGPGLGSEFRVALPLVEPTTAVELAARSTPRPLMSDAGPLLRLLIVDDDSDLAHTLAELLTGLGFITRVAEDGEEAIRAFAEFSPQAALIDISLPMMNGRDLARRLRASGTEARLIALSGYGRQEDEEASLESGFDLHLVKPIRADEIAAYLRGLAAGDDSQKASL